MKLKTLLALLICVFATLVKAEDTVRLHPTFADFAVTATTSSTISLNTDVPTEQPTTEATAAKVYVPLMRTATDSHKYFLDSVNGLPTILDIEDAAKKVNFPLRLNVSVTTQYLYAAVYDPDASQWEVIAAYPSNPLSSLTNVDVAFPVSPKSICDHTACLNLGSAATSNQTKTFKLYFFLSTTTSYTLGTAITPGTAPLNNGIYFNVGMSNRVALPADYAGTISGIRRGDRRLIIEYSTSGMLDAESIRIFNHNGANGTADLPIGESAVYNAGAGLMATEYPYQQTGEITVRDLTNSTSYFLSVLIVDKYKFATPLSNVVEGTPAEIQELLKENGCFLITAGFGENHYVIDYFRQFRDRILMHNWLGQKFVKVYYELAPEYALFIYENETLRALIRGIAYVLYFAFNHIALVILGTFLIPAGFILAVTLRKIKILKA